MLLAEVARPQAQPGWTGWEQTECFWAASPCAGTAASLPLPPYPGCLLATQGNPREAEFCSHVPMLGCWQGREQMWQPPVGSMGKGGSCRQAVAADGGLWMFVSEQSSCAREPLLMAVWIFSALPFNSPHRLPHSGLT